jgi:hypothetical protein
VVNTLLVLPYRRSRKHSDLALLRVLRVSVVSLVLLFALPGAAGNPFALLRVLRVSPTALDFSLIFQLRRTRGEPGFIGRHPGENRDPAGLGC